MADRNSADDGAVSHVRFSPLSQQFVEPDAIFEELRELVRSGDFTLGKPVGEFEAMFATAVGTKHAIGVGSGTDALKIPLKGAWYWPWRRGADRGQYLLCFGGRHRRGWCDASVCRLR